MAAAEVREVLEFLRRNGFDLAAAALRDDVEEEGVLLPPVRTGVVGDRADGDGYGGAGSFSSTSSSSDAFVSMGSSPTDLTNPYGLWPAGNAEPSESSDTNSEFGTAREYNDSNIFSDVNWFDEKYGGYSKDPYLVPTNYDSAPSEDKFSMALESEEIFGKKSDPHFIVEMDVGGLDRPPGKLHKDCEECTKICGQTVPHYDVYGDTKEFNSLSVDQVEDPMSSNYRNHAAGNQEERPGTAREVSFQLVEDSPEADYWEGALSDHLHYEPKLGKQIKNLDSQLFEKELHMLSTNGSAQKGDKSVSVGDLLTHSLDKSNAAKLFKKVEAQQLEKELHMLSLQSLVQSSRTNEKERQTIDCQMDNGVEADMDDNKLQGDYDFPFVTEEPSWEGVNDIFHYKDHGSIIVDTKDHGLVSDGKDDNHTTDEIQLHYSPEEEYEIFELRIVHRKNRTGFEESKELPIVLNSVTAGRYYITEYLGSAAFSKVVQAHDLQTGVDVCLKIIKNDKDFFDQSLDEIKLLKYVNKHDPADENHILRLYDYFYHQEHLFIVCELLKANLYEFQKYNQESGGELYFTLPRIQSIARQCLEALEYLHRLGIIHCDLKPENILIKSYSRCEIKIIDLGSSCFYTDKLSFYVQSRSYRAPEVILGLPYDNKIDIWSLGCILVELLTGDVLFPNDSVEILLARMIGVLGPIDVEMLDLGQETHKYFTNDYDLYHKDEESGQIEYIIPQSLSLAHLLGYPDPAFVNFLLYLLQTNPRRRPSVIEALQHPWLSYQYQ